MSDILAPVPPHAAGHYLRMMFAVYWDNTMPSIEMLYLVPQPWRG